MHLASEDSIDLRKDLAGLFVGLGDIQRKKCHFMQEKFFMAFIWL